MSKLVKAKKQPEIKIDYEKEIKRVQEYYEQCYVDYEAAQRTHTESTYSAHMHYNCPDCGGQGKPTWPEEPCSSLECKNEHYWWPAKNETMDTLYCGTDEDDYFPPEVMQKLKAFRFAARSKVMFAMGYAYEKLASGALPVLKTCFAPV